MRRREGAGWALLGLAALALAGCAGQGASLRASLPPPAGPPPPAAAQAAPGPASGAPAAGAPPASPPRAAEAEPPAPPEAAPEAAEAVEVPAASAPGDGVRPLAQAAIGGDGPAAPRGAPEAAPPAAPLGHGGEDQEDEAPADLWALLRAGLALPRTHHPRVQAELRWYAAHPAYLERLAQRAAPYLGYILERVRARGMPTEIALLPAVESAFQPFAYSPGRAAGLWQFIPATARRYGLRLSWWYDGRRDLVDATRAALDYLEHLHRTFDGDWLLALAAYNAGEGTVLQALRRNRRRGRPADFWSLDLPRETRQYVPRLLALAALVAEPERHGARLPPLPAGRRLAVVETGSQIDLALAAELAGLSIEEIYRLNPGFNRWATDPDGPHRLVLPAEKAEAFRQALARVPPERRIQWRRHRIRPGETLGHIARRYRTTVALLRRVNGLRGHVIRAGDHLLVPVAARSLGAYTLTELARRRALQRRPRGAVRLVHVIQPGDTLWDLARRYGVRVRQLAAWNGLAPGDLLHPGRELVVWKGRPDGRAPALARVVERKILYVVRPGDSLARISQRFKVTVRDLARWNGLDLDDYIHPGQRLTLYVDVTRLAESG